MLLEFETVPCYVLSLRYFTLQVVNAAYLLCLRDSQVARDNMDAFKNAWLDKVNFLFCLITCEAFRIIQLSILVFCIIYELTQDTSRESLKCA